MKFSKLSLVENETANLLGLIIFLIVVTLYRAIALAAADLPLFFDEAYYFTWSQNLEFGYYSKPPLIAWVIAATTNLCGEGELCVRAPALLIHPCTAFGLFLIGCRLYGVKVGRLAAAIYITLPMISASSWIISTDVLLLFFWTYGLWFLIGALENTQWRNWLGFGVCLGMGLLSKYTMIVFALSLILYLIFSPIHREHLRHPKFYAALFLAILIFSPNIFWNIFHGWISLRHTADNAALDRPLFHPIKLLEFLGSQILIFSPVLSMILPAAMMRREELTRNKELTGTEVWRRGLLLALSLPLFVIITGEALMARSNANWAAPSYLCFTLLISAWFMCPKDQEKQEKMVAKKCRSHGHLLIAAFTLNILIAGLGYHHDALYRIMGTKPARHLDPYARLRGWRELADQVQKLRTRYPNTGIVGNDRILLAELGYYLQPRPWRIAAWNPLGEISDQYRLSADIRQRPKGDYLFVTRGIELESISATFTEAHDLGRIRIATHRDSVIECSVFWVRNFQGYRS
ncbi:PMT_2 domain-containing protein [Gammaproteobacteria bacterium]